MKLNNRTYDFFKFFAIVVMPAFTTLVGTIGVQLGYEMTTPIVILTALDTFLGTLLGISSVTYSQSQNKPSQPVGTNDQLQ